jgi:hypothetical protein
VQILQRIQSQASECNPGQREAVYYKHQIAA